MRLFSLIILFIFTSCVKSKNDSATTNKIGMESELYNKILEYQTKHPIPKMVEYDKTKPPPVETSFIYIYEAKFIKDNNETVLSITLYPTGISSYYDKKNINVTVNGIYSDSKLKATYINDPFKLGNNFVKNYLTNEEEMKKYIYPRGIILDSMYDVDLYKIKDGKLVFYKILKGNVQ